MENHIWNCTNHNVWNTFVTCFPSIWRYKTTFSRILSNHNVWNISYLLFSTSRYKTISRTFFPYFFNKKKFIFLLLFFSFYIYNFFFSPTGNIISGQITRKNGVNPVVHVRTQGNPFGVSWPSITCTTFCTTTLVRKKTGTFRACTRDHFRDFWTDCSSMRNGQIH